VSERRFVDLHTHSTASDGSVSPAELIRLADKANLAAVALADHDTTAGLVEALAEAAAHPALRFIPAIELSARFEPAAMHIVGLGIDPDQPRLQAVVEDLLAARNERNPKLIARLQEMGLDVTMDDMLAEVPGDVADPQRVVGRMHLAQALQRKGYVRTTTEAFQKYIGDGCPAYVDKERLSPRQAIEAILAAGGVAVLAHPGLLGLDNRAQLRRVLQDAMAAGLTAVEAYHSDHSPDQTRLTLDVARQLGLGVSGGSDFHGAAKPDAILGRPRISTTMLTGDVARLLAR